MPRKAPKKPKKKAATKAVAVRPGRPSLLTDEVWSICVEAVRAGHYDEPVAARAGISRATLLAWIRTGRRELRAYEEQGGELTRHAQFVRAIDKANAEAEGKALQKIRENADWRALAWYLERRHQDRWALQKQGEEFTAEVAKMATVLFQIMVGVLRRHLSPEQSRPVILEFGRAADDTFGHMPGLSKLGQTKEGHEDG